MNTYTIIYNNEICHVVADSYYEACKKLRNGEN